MARLAKPAHEASSQSSLLVLLVALCSLGRLPGHILERERMANLATNSVRCLVGGRKLHGN